MDNFLGIHHVNVIAKDMGKSVTFYRDILGFSLVRERRVGEMKLAELSLGETLLEIKEADKNACGHDGAVDHLAIRVADIFSAWQYLKDQGIEMITPEPRAISSDEYILFFRGPSGEKIELISR